jgi:hypothetical protein
MTDLHLPRRWLILAAVALAQLKRSPRSGSPGRRRSRRPGWAVCILTAGALTTAVLFEHDRVRAPEPILEAAG